jgi:tetratricopeptide (TPR) repeat protein
MDLAPTSTVGGWTLIERLGAGAFGTTWRAVDCRGRQAAVKTLAEPPGAELRALASIVHPSVIGVIDSGTSPVPYIAMDLAHGQPLTAIPKPLTIPQTVQIIASLSDALSALHDAGLAHGDVKSANVLVRLSPSIEIRLVDFGMAGTSEGGTLAYAAPERLGGTKSSPESDVYALGLVLWELLHGDLPWGHMGSDRALLRRRYRVPKATVGPAWLRQLLSEMLSIQAGVRPTASAVADTLTSHGAVLPAPTPQLVRRRARSTHVPMLADEGLATFLKDGGSITIVGRPGQGRTHHIERLVTELAAQGRPFVRLQGDRRPWSAVEPALTDRRLPGAPVVPLIAASDEDRAQAAAKGLLRRVNGPLHILVDDIDSLDSASRMVVDLLIRHRDARVCVSSDRVIPGTRGIELQDLTRDGAMSFIEQLLGSATCAEALVETAHSFSSGNPSLTLSWLVAAVEQHAVVWRARTWVADTSRIPYVRPATDGRDRVTALSEEGRHLAAAVALFGQPIDVTTLSEVTGQSREMVREGLLVLVDAALVRIESELVQTANGAVSELLVGAIDDVRPLHAAIAMRLFDTFPAPLVRIAWHAAHAHDHSLVNVIGADALREAMQRDVNEAAELADALWKCAEGDSELALLRLRALAAAGQTDRALQFGQTWVGSPDADDALLIEMARVHLLSKNVEGALELVERVKNGDKANSLDAIEVEMSASFHGEDFERAVRRAGDLPLRRPRTAAKLDKWLTIQGIYAQSLHALGKIDDSIAVLESIPTDLGEGRRARPTVDAILGRLLWHSGRVAEAGEVMLRASRVSAGLPLTDRARLANNAGLASYKTGALDDALARWERARLLFERLNDVRSQVAVQLNLCVGYREVGRWTRARRAGEWALSNAEAADLKGYAAMAAGNLGDVHFALEAWEDARTLYAQALEASQVANDIGEQVECMRRLAGVALAIGEDALPLARATITAARREEQFTELWRATAIESVALARIGDTSAVELVEQAVDGLRNLEATRELAEARLSAAEVYASAERGADAVAAIAQVMHYAEDVGSVDLAQRAQRLSERLQTRVQLAPDVSLADRALEVAASIASEQDLGSALQQLVDASRDIACAERAFAVLLEPALHVAARSGATAEEEPAWPLVERSLRSARELIVADLGDRPDLRASTSQLLMELRAVMVIPMTLDGVRLGALVIDGRHASEQQLLSAQAPLRSLCRVAASSILRQQQAKHLDAARVRNRQTTESLESAIDRLVEAQRVLEQEVQTPIGRNAMAVVRSASSDMARFAGEYESETTSQIDPVDVGALARESSAMIRHLAKRLSVTIDVDASREAWVQCSEEDLRTGIYSLLSRAIHVSVSDQVVSLSVHRQRDDVVLEVRDFGPDLAHPSVHRLVGNDAEARTRHAARAALRGVNDAGGTLNCCNHPQGGAVFTMRIPAMDSLPS